MNNTIISNVSRFSNDSSIALVIHFGDGQSYRVNTTDSQQFRIGVEGLKLAFPELIPLNDQQVAFAFLRGKYDGSAVSYDLVPSKKLDTMGKPYMNVRLVAKLASATDEQLATLLGFGANDGL